MTPATLAPRHDRTSVANACAVIAANRTDREEEMTFYGSSFVADHRGDILARLGRTTKGVLVATRPDAQRRYRAGFGFFRDRRPDLYRPIADDGDKNR
jgi:N-carbamoylputrescine amidase